MSEEINKIQEKLIGILKRHLKHLKVTADEPGKFEVSGNVPTMQGKKQVDGIYFATVAPKPKDVRFYFFPIYTHKEALTPMPDNLTKALKGKSCFHIKSMDSAFEKNLTELVSKAVEIYKKDSLLK